MNSSCNQSGLNAYTPSTSKPWNEKRIQHLYRRIGMGATPQTIKEALNRSAQEVIDEIVQEATQKPVMEDPGWGYWNQQQIEDFYQENYIGTSRKIMEYQFFDDLISGSLRDRLHLFWSNHFVTEDASMGMKKPPYLFQQYIMRQKYAIGNFKDFVRAVGLNPYMLRYLNGYQNKAGSPNENYARELYELFTLGVDNGYTESDIVETSRALTGYNTKESSWGKILFNEKGTFDDSEKTIFGRTGNWGYDDVIDILFEEKAPLIAHYICRKFYHFFISPEANEDIVAGLATTFLENNFEIAPVMLQLFKSEHFFDDASIGTIIKSPIELVVPFQKELSMYILEEDKSLAIISRGISYNLEMPVFTPPNVAGWPGGENWINSVTFPERWLRMSHVLVYQFRDSRDYTDKDDYHVFADFAIELFEDINTSAEDVATGIIDFFLTKKSSDATTYEEGIAVFKGNTPEQYFTDGTWNLEYPTVGQQVYNLLRKHIIILPEFQLI